MDGDWGIYGYGWPQEPQAFLTGIGATNTQQGTGRERPVPSAPCTNEAIICSYCIKPDHFTSENQ